jgi:hypothetical protein
MKPSTNWIDPGKQLRAPRAAAVAGILFSDLLEVVWVENGVFHS